MFLMLLLIIVSLKLFFWGLVCRNVVFISIDSTNFNKSNSLLRLFFNFFAYYVSYE